jgi:pantetheine-phosphate adenylyltransferase
VTHAVPERRAIYPGTFDPPTNGHIDIVERALEVFDRVTVAIAVNPRKQPTFTVDERKDLIRAALPHEDRVEIDAFEGLLVDYVRRVRANVILRGLRAVADFEYEFQLAHMNRRLAPHVHTLFMTPSEENFYVSSSLVKEVAMFGGDVSALVPPPVLEALRARLGRTP